jgi:hypothetical protein
MSSDNQLTAVEAQIETKLGFFNSRTRYNRRMALIFTLAPAIMSAIATVSIGVSEQLSVKWFLVIALIASGSATVLGAWEGLFANRKMWVIAGIASAELEELKWDIDYRKKNTAAVITSNEIDAFNDRFKKIIQKTENAWQTTIGKS